MEPYDRLRPWTTIEACLCETLTSLILVDLFTDNPIHCEQCRREVDPERLQLSREDVADVANWFRIASSLYLLWLASGEYEAFAKQALLDPLGDVNVKGLRVAKQLSKYFPTKLWFFHDTDDGEPTHCPVCFKELDLDVAWGSGTCHTCKIQM